MEYPIDCNCGCDETEDKDVYYEDIHGAPIPVEYDVCCKGCGKILGHYSYGNWTL